MKKKFKNEGDKRQMKGKNADGEETGLGNEKASLRSAETLQERQHEGWRVSGSGR